MYSLFQLFSPKEPKIDYITDYLLKGHILWETWLHCFDQIFSCFKKHLNLISSALISNRQSSEYKVTIVPMSYAGYTLVKSLSDYWCPKKNWPWWKRWWIPIKLVMSIIGYAYTIENHNRILLPNRFWQPCKSGLAVFGHKLYGSKSWLYLSAWKIMCFWLIWAGRKDWQQSYCH